MNGNFPLESLFKGSPYLNDPDPNDFLIVFSSLYVYNVFCGLWCFQLSTSQEDVQWPNTGGGRSGMGGLNTCSAF